MQIYDFATNGNLLTEHIPALEAAWHQLSTDLEKICIETDHAINTCHQGWWLMECIELWIAGVNAKPKGEHEDVFGFFDPKKSRQMGTVANILRV